MDATTGQLDHDDRDRADRHHQPKWHEPTRERSRGVKRIEDAGELAGHSMGAAVSDR